jgi:CRP/FNR family transcriptional regulator, cyclic AMP receptor protein
MAHGFTPENLTGFGVQRRYQKGIHIVQELDEGGSLFVVQRGSVKAYSANLDDKEIIYGIYGPGEVFGEMALDGGPRSASVLTLEKTECLEVRFSEVAALLRAKPELALDLVKLVIARARSTTEAARRMALLDVYGRLRIFLEEQSVPLEAGKRELKIGYTHQQLAQHLGASREMISRLLKDLELGGFVAEGGGKKLVLQKRLPERW